MSELDQNNTPNVFGGVSEATKFGLSNDNC